MNPATALALILGLYEQLAAVQRENGQLRQRVIELEANGAPDEADAAVPQAARA